MSTKVSHAAPLVQFGAVLAGWSNMVRAMQPHFHRGSTKVSLGQLLPALSFARSCPSRSPSSPGYNAVVWYRTHNPTRDPRLWSRVRRGETPGARRPGSMLSDLKSTELCDCHVVCRDGWVSLLSASLLYLSPLNLFPGYVSGGLWVREKQQSYPSLLAVAVRSVVPVSHHLFRPASYQCH